MALGCSHRSHLGGEHPSWSQAIGIRSPEEVLHAYSGRPGATWWMSAASRELIDVLRRRPRMYLISGGYAEICAALVGFDIRDGGDVLSESALKAKLLQLALSEPEGCGEPIGLTGSPLSTPSSTSRCASSPCSRPASPTPPTRSPAPKPPSARWRCSPTRIGTPHAPIDLLDDTARRGWAHVQFRAAQAPAPGPRPHARVRARRDRPARPSRIADSTLVAS